MGNNLVKIESTEEYRRLLQSFADYHLLQSSMWKDVLDAGDKNHKSTSYVWTKNGQPLFLARITPYSVFKQYAIVTLPFGPLVNLNLTPSGEDLNEFLKHLASRLSGYKPVALHLNPFSLQPEANSKLRILFGQCAALVPARPMPYQPGDGTITFDTSKPPEEGLLPGCREDTRYNLKRAQRENRLEISLSKKPSDLEAFWALYKKAQERIGFKQGRTDLYETALKMGHALLFLASERATNKLVSGVLAVLFQEQQSVITLISATSPEGNKLRAPTLLRWKIFEWAHQNGYKKVDFFSIRKTPEDKDQSEQPAQSGYTFFKTGFGGELVWYNTPYLFPINKPLLAIHAIYAKLFNKKN